MPCTCDDVSPPTTIPEAKTKEAFDASGERFTAGLRERALEELSNYFTEDQIVELTLAICVANFTNRFNDAMQLQLDLGV